MQYQWLELFAGGGGVATGLEAAGHTVSAAIEIDPKIAACYAANHPGHVLFQSDIRDYSIINNLPSDINALWASPVCKGHSNARGKTLPDREDTSIGLAILPYIDAIQPELIVIENVKQYVNHSSYQVVISYLIKLHYTLDIRVLNMADYGVPQNRERLIVQARRGPIAHPDKVGRIGWMQGLQGLHLQTGKLANWQNLMQNYNYPVLVYGHYNFKEDGRARELVIDPAWVPCKTIISSHNTLDRRVVYPDGSCLSLGIAGNARLQTFPDAYAWPSIKKTAIEIIGNAVPPLFVEKLAGCYSLQALKNIA